MTDEINFNDLRTKLKKEYGKLYDEIGEILFLTDIMGLGPEMNDNFDEYDPEVNRILLKLEDATSEQDVLGIVLIVFEKMFTRVNLFAKKTYGSAFEEYEDSPKDLRERYNIASQQIWQAWLKYPTDERCVRIK